MASKLQIVELIESLKWKSYYLSEY
jgi:hypothetical protein